MSNSQTHGQRLQRQTFPNRSCLVLTPVLGTDHGHLGGQVDRVELAPFCHDLHVGGGVPECEALRSQDGRRQLGTTLPVW